MRTETYKQVEAIVEKYKRLAAETEEGKRTKKVLENEDEIERFNFVDHILIRVSQLISGKNERSCYITGLLNKEDEQFLVDNVAALIDYAFDHSCIILDMDDDYIDYANDFDKPEEWSRIVSCLLKNKSGKIYIGRSDQGREYADLDDCELTIEEQTKSAFQRAFSNGKSIVYRKVCNGKKDNIFLDDCIHDNEIINRETGGRIYVKDLNLDSRLWYDGDGQFDTAIIDIHQRDISFVEKCFEGCCRIVKEGGEILLCVSMEAILSEETAAMRDRLKREQMLSEVIQLPSGNILLHIIMSPQESFIMCNAKKLSKKITYSNRIVVDKEAFMKEMELAKRGETLIVRRYEYERLDSNILIPMYYITEGVSVAELTNTISETVLSDECCKEEKVVTINHLSKVFTKSGFSVDGLSALRQDRLRRYYRVNGPAVIIAVSKKDIAVGYTTDTAPFLVPDNLYVMIPKEGIDVRYLAGKLLSKSIKEQVVTLIRSHGLDKFIETKLIPGWTKIVRMGLDSSEGQQQFIHEISMKEFAEQEKEAITQEKRFRHSIRLRKHALIQNVSAFESLFHSLEYYMAEHSGAIIKPEDKLSTVSQMTVGEAMKILHKDLATISDRIERLTDGNDWGKCEIIEPQEFIESYEKQHTSTDFRFENGWTPLLYNDWLNKVLGITRDSGFNNNTYQEDELDEKTGKLLHYEGEPKYAAWFPRKALEQVLDNIVANARAHGFKDKSRKDYAIEADWKTDGLNMIISISNNGEPLPSDVDTDLVLEYGYTTALNQEGHGGIGGGEIAEIMRKFGGSARVTSTPDSDYTVTYELTMPLASDY